MSIFRSAGCVLLRVVFSTSYLLQFWTPHAAVHNPHSWRWTYRCPKHVQLFMIINHNCCIKLVPLVIFSTFSLNSALDGGEGTTRRPGRFNPEKTQYPLYRGADKSLARPTSQYILFDVDNISFDASPVIYINSTKISPIKIINRIYENQNLLSL